MPVNHTIKLRRDTGANWEAKNPVLSAGEVALDSTKNAYKVGDGTKTWTQLSYLMPGNLTAIRSGTSSVIFDTVNGNVEIGVNGNATLVEFRKDNSFINNQLEVDGDYLTGTMTMTTDANGDPIPGTITTWGNMLITHDLFVLGAVTSSVDQPTFNVPENIANLGFNNITDIVDIGVIANANNGTANFNTGFYRDASDAGTFKFFNNLTEYPNGKPVASGSLTLADIQVGGVDATLLLTGSNASANNIFATGVFKGDASNITQATPSNGVAGGTSNIFINNNSNINLSMGGVANVGVVTKGGISTSLNVSVSGNSNLNSASNLTITGGTAGQFAKTDGNGNVTWSAFVTDRIANGTSNVLANTQHGVIHASVNGHVDAATFSGTGLGSDLPVTITGNITAANIVATGSITGTLDADSNAQPNVTSLGTLTSLTVDGDPSANGSYANVVLGSVNGNLNLGPAGNIKVTGGTLGYSIQTDGAGNVTFWENANFVGAPWATTNSYGVGQVIKYKGSLYIANDDIPANYGFKLGVSGKTWKPLGGLTYTHTSTLTNAINDGALDPAAIDISAAINVPQTTPNIYYTLRAPTSPAPRILTINNTGTEAFYINGDYRLAPNYSVVAVWTGSAWQFAAVNPGISNWYFNEAATGLSYSGKGGTFYAVDTTLTSIGNAVAPQNVEGFISGVLSGTGSFQAYGGGNIKLTNLNTYTGSTNVKYSTRMTYLDNGGLGTAVANTTQTYASTGTISTVGNTVTRTFSADSMMVFPVTSVPTTYAANLFVVAGGGGGGAGSLAVNDLAVNGKGGGGGAGGEVISASVIVTPGTVLEFTIGQGGTGGVTDSESGDQGGATTVTVIEGSMTYANATPITSLTARGGRGGGGGQSFTQQNRGGVGWNVVSGGSSTDTIYGANDRTAAGTGITSTISNTQFAVGGGSGGSANQTGTTVANGASGGNGSTNRSTDATSGASASSGTGSGGGGGAGQSHGRAGSPGGNGGSGQVQIQFQTKQGGSLATGGVSTSAGTTTIHTFSGDGLFTIPLTSTISNVRYLMVGGGGGGAGVEDSITTGSGWGGGEGGEVKSGYITVTPGQTLNITVGAGGGYTKVGTALRGQKGGDTVISGQGFTTLTAVGGNGASAKPGGTGGPGADGGAGLTGNGGNGGTGTSNDITGLTVFYGGGGGGGRGTSGTTAGSGGNGGGGSGGGISQPGANGLTGGGGGGAGASNGVAGAFPGGSGGKGLVVFSYTTPINAYDVTTNSSYSIEGVFEHDAYNNQIFTNTLQGNGSYEKKRYTVDTFTNFVNLAGNVKVQQGILRIGNGSSASMNMGSNIETSDNTETIYYSPATVASRYNVYRPISGAGNVIFDAPSSTQGQYSLTSTLAGVTGNLIIRANASLIGSTAVNFPANITVDNGGALHANSSVSVWSGNATISGNGQAFYGVTGAIGIESGSTLSANIKMLDDSKIYIYANAGSNTASTTTISSAITGDKIMYLQTATMNPVSLTGSIDSTQPLTLVSGNYTFATTFNTNPSMGVELRSGTNVILTEDVTWGNLNSETNTTITAPSATTVITLGYNHRSATMRSNIKLGSINKVGTGTQAIDVDLLPTTLANVTGNTTVTAGILDVGGNTNGGYLPFGNINVAANSVLRLSRTDLISKGNTAVNAFQQGIPLNQNLVGTGNIELYGNIQQSECTGYYPGLYYPAQENHTMPDNTGFTGNLLINAGSKWSVFSDVDRFSNVIVGSNGALHLKAYYNESVFRTSGTFTVPTGTTYTAQYVVIGGGGGGGGGVYYSSGTINYRAGGGGGGGGIASGRNTALAPSTYTITVGAGGTSGPSRTDGTDWPTLGGVGGTSSAFGLTATGGQGGRASTYAANGSVGTPGASTGGQGQWSSTNGTINQNAGQGALSTVTTANTYWQSTRWATAGSGGLSGIWTVVQNSTTSSASPAGALGARGTTAPSVPTEWGGGGGGGGVTRNADNTAFITHNGGVGANGAVGILWYNNATEFVYTPNVSITGNGTQEGGVQYGAINCTDGNWNLTGNITVATTGGVTDTKIYANKQVRFTGQNITGSANLNIDGTAGGLVVLATTTNTMSGNIKCYYGQNLAFNTSISTGCSANIIVQAWSGQSSTLHIGQTESNIAFTTSGNLNVQTNGRVKFYSQGTNQLSRINVNNLTVGTSWTVDIMGNLTQNGTYTIIGSTQTLPSTVPSVGTVPTGKTVVFSYVNGTGLVATVS